VGARVKRFQIGRYLLTGKEAHWVLSIGGVVLAAWICARNRHVREEPESASGGRFLDITQDPRHPRNFVLPGLARLIWTS
jgi:hypothetical protein